MKDYLILSGFVLIAMIFIYACNGVFPFGAYSIAAEDSYEQIIPFFSHIKDILSGGEFFSVTDAGGMETLGPILYIGLNPFLYLMLPFCLMGANLYYVINFILPINMLCIALVALWFIKKYYPNLKSTAIILSFMYTFCGYFFISYIWLSWLPFLLYLPLLANEFMKLVKDGKIAGFSAMLTLFVYLCFGLGAYTLVFLFVIFAGYIFIVADKQDRKRVFSQIVISYVIAVFLSVPVLVPALIATGNSMRDASYFDLFTPSKLFGRIKIYYFAFDIIFVLLSVLFVIKCGKKNKFNKFLLFALCVTMLPVIFDPIERALNMGRYVGLANRFYFLNVFIMLLSSCNFLQSASIKLFTKQKTVSLFLSACSVISVIAGTLTCFVNLTIPPASISSLIADIKNNERINVQIYEKVSTNYLHNNKNNFSLFGSLMNKKFYETYRLLDSGGYNLPNGFSNRKDDNYLNFMSSVVLGQDYFLLQSETNIPDFKEVNRSGDYILYKNELSFGGAYFLDSVDFTALKPNQTASEKINHLFAAIGGKGDLSADILFDDYKLTYTAAKDCVLSTAAFMNDKFATDINYVVINNERYKVNELPTLFYIEAGNTCEIEIITQKRESEVRYFANVIDYDLLAKFCKNKKASFGDIKMGLPAGNEITVTAVKQKNLNYLVMPYINYESYKVTLNGKEVSLTDNKLNFLAVDISSIADGSDISVTFEYIMPHKNLYIFVLFFGIAAGVITLLLYQFVYKKFAKIQIITDKFAYWVGISAAAVIVILMFVIPLGYTLWTVSVFG